MSIKKIIFSGVHSDLADFESFARRAKQSGATHIRVSDGLPWSYWEYDQPGDPYPAWVISNCNLLKITVPEALRPYLPAEFSAKVLDILEARSRVLRSLGLKAAFRVFDPGMLPEKVFRDHPLWRGPRVDHPQRSRVARFAPTVDHPEVLAMYREAIGILLRRCPEIELLSIITNDSGTGLDWSGGLYNGRIGNTLFRHRPMHERLRGFFTALQEGAKAVGGSLEVGAVWTREDDPAKIAVTLGPGMAIENLEGPNATAFLATAGFEEGYWNTFCPVVGIPQPMLVLEGLTEAIHGESLRLLVDRQWRDAGGDRIPAVPGIAPRLLVAFGDRLHRDLYFDLFDLVMKRRPRTEIERLALLEEFAVARYGAEKARAHLQIWEDVHQSSRTLEILQYGGHLVHLGPVQQRWLTRPFVPFPNELTDEEKSYFRRFLFQAREERFAESLSDVQACTVYAGWGGRYFVNRVVEPVLERFARAARLARELGDPTQARRFDVFSCFMTTVRNAVSYQAQLDRVRQRGVTPDPDPVPGTRSDWDRQLMLETVRTELDNTAVLMDLLRPSPAEYLELASTPEEEDIRRLGPNILEQLQRKLDITNAHWSDYRRVFTTPN